jgi:hypothetical protein
MVKRPSPSAPAAPVTVRRQPVELDMLMLRALVAFTRIENARTAALAGDVGPLRFALRGLDRIPRERCLAALAAQGITGDEIGEVLDELASFAAGGDLSPPLRERLGG